MRSLAARMMGAPPPGRVITYSWGGTHEAARCWSAPLGDEGRIALSADADDQPGHTLARIDGIRFQGTK